MFRSLVSNIIIFKTRRESIYGTFFSIEVIVLFHYKSSLISAKAYVAQRSRFSGSPYIDLIRSRMRSCVDALFATGPRWVFQIHSRFFTLLLLPYESSLDAKY